MQNRIGNAYAPAFRRKINQSGRGRPLADLTE
jgi:hypothetical protein